MRACSVAVGAEKLLLLLLLLLWRRLQPAHLSGCYKAPADLQRCRQASHHLDLCAG